jgi:F-type H+-transporting ATPase subunit a
VPTTTMLATTVTVGEHPTVKVLGLTINVDTVLATVLAMLVVFALGFAVRRQLTRGVPGRLQLAWETVVQAVTNQVEGTIGPRGISIIPLAVTLFVFILVCNFFEIFGLGGKYELLAVPTADVNLPAAMALFVIVLVHIASIRTRGIGGYLRHYLTQPFPVVLAPFNLFINLVEEIAKPITLALRLFGNLFSGGLMITLIAALGAWKLGSIPVGNVVTLILAVVWKLFDVFFIGPIQAFIFALLTILYFDTAMSTDHDEVLVRPESEPIPNV